MAQSWTLRELREHALDLADATESRDLSPSYIRRIINLAADRLYRKALRIDGEERYRQVRTITLTPGQATVAVQDGFERLAGVRWNRSDGLKPKLHRMTWGQYLERDAIEEIAWFEGDVYYVPGFDEITLWPTPSAAYEIEVYYVPRRVELVNESDKFQALGGFEQLICLYAAKQIRMRRGQAISMIQQEIMQLEDDMLSETGELDQLDPQTVRDIHPAYDGAWFRERD